jgi:hypothetical protein
LTIDAGAGDAVFDTSRTSEGTTGSAYGWAFERTSTNPGLMVGAQYRDLVSLNGYAPVGDLYRGLNFIFTWDAGGMGFLGTMSFIADTDNLSIQGDITPTPEPTTMLLLGLGLMGLAGVRRFKN